MNFRGWLVLAVVLFVIGLIMGLMVPPESGGFFFREAAALDELADIIAPLPQAAVFLIILIKNISVIVVSLILSPLFCLMPVLTLVINGSVIGFLSSIIIQETSVSFLLAGMLPHGIFELPALIIGEAVSISFGMAVIQGLFNKERRGLISLSIKNNVKYLAISISLFLIAAVIETYLTPVLINMVD